MLNPSLQAEATPGACLVSGASGFVGKALLNRLRQSSGETVIGAVRKKPVTGMVDAAGVRIVEMGDIDGRTDWSAALDGVRSVVHAAARVHVMREQPGAAQASLFHRTNVEASLRLASQAAEAGVQRFVFVSSIKVHGESTPPALPFRADDLPKPSDAYAVSKHEAEVGLRDIAVRTGMELVIVRPPLVYGPGVKANFAGLMKAVAAGMPLPFAGLDNRRSLIGLDNLVDFLSTCLVHSAAVNQTFLVSDGEDVSTPELVRRLARAMQRSARLFAVPPSLLTAAAGLLGRRAAVERLCGNLQVDISKTRTLLQWTPPMSLDDGLRRAAEGAAR